MWYNVINVKGFDMEIPDMIEDDEILEPLTIEELADILNNEYGLSAEVRQVRKNLKMLFVMTEDPPRA